MFPQDSYNTPFGRQFGRERAAFFEDEEIKPEVWNETREAQTFIPTYEEQAIEQYPATAPSIEQRNVEAVQAAEAAQSVETIDRKAYVDYARQVTMNIRLQRNAVLGGQEETNSKSDWTLAA